MKNSEVGRFEEGQKKPKGSGRQKGTLNKRSQHLIEVLDSVSFNLPERILELLPQLQPEKQADILLGLMPYVYPKRKAVELSGPQITPYLQDLIDRDNELKSMTPEELESAAEKMHQKLMIAKGRATSYD